MVYQASKPLNFQTSEQRSPGAALVGGNANAGAGSRGLFPLDGADGFGGEVEEDAVDTGDLVGDAVGEALHEGPGEALDGGGHGVDGVDGGRRSGRRG